MLRRQRANMHVNGVGLLGALAIAMLGTASGCSDHSRTGSPGDQGADAADAGSSEGGDASAEPDVAADVASDSSDADASDSGIGEGDAADGGDSGDIDGDASSPDGAESHVAPVAYAGCPTSQEVGWATVDGLGFTGPTTGGSGPEVTVSNAADLETYATSQTPYVIVVSGVVDIPVLDVTSNKTIRGAGPNSGIRGGIRLAGASTAQADMVSNVVIQNLSILAATSSTADAAVDNDGISIAYAHHVWVDHVSVTDAPGDDITIMHGSDYVTVSWSVLDHTMSGRDTGMLIGHADTDTADDTGHLKVSLHHNWWGHAVTQRMPRVRFGEVHVFNNYYSATNDIYCVAAALDSSLLVENNYFDGVLNPHVFFSFNGSTSSFSEPTAQMVATGNTYIGNSNLDGGMQSGQGSAFVPDYSASLEPADGALVEEIQLCAGPQ
jgi:pectate lyase